MRNLVEALFHSRELASLRSEVDWLRVENRRLVRLVFEAVDHE